MSTVLRGKRLAEPRQAADLAHSLLADMGARWDHTRRVAARAQIAAASIPEPDRSLLVAAAWLHDIGYSAQVADTGFHALDGARHLADLDAPDDLVGAVAHHSFSQYEAIERGLGNELKAFPPPSVDIMDALAFAHMTIGPTGQVVSVEDRLAEIFERYRPSDPVHKAISKARADLMTAVNRIEISLAASKAHHPI